MNPLNLFSVFLLFVLFRAEVLGVDVLENIYLINQIYFVNFLIKKIYFLGKISIKFGTKGKFKVLNILIFFRWK